MRYLLFLACLVLGTANAQGDLASQLATYAGADREQRLVAGPLRAQTQRKRSGHLPIR